MFTATFTSLHFINCLVPEDLKTFYCCVSSSFPQKRRVCFSFYKDIIFEGKLKHRSSHLLTVLPVLFCILWLCAKHDKNYSSFLLHYVHLWVERKIQRKLTKHWWLCTKEAFILIIQQGQGESTQVIHTGTLTAHQVLLVPLIGHMCLQNFRMNCKSGYYREWL